ncbi:MAG: ABC transporter ATP-binding protein, partial [Phycisphaerales bacterium]
LIYVGVRRRLQSYGRRQTAAGQARAKALQEGFGGVKEIIVLNVRDLFRREFSERCWEISKTSADAQVIGQSPKHILECIAVGGLVAVAMVLSSGDQSAGPWLAQISFLGLAAYRLLPALQATFQSIATMRVSRPAFENIAADLRAGREREARPALAVPQGWQHHPAKAIELRDLSFRYTPDRPPALDGVELSIRSGTTVGFVGPSGSGKTTTADIVLGLLVPESGALVVDGETIDDSNRAAWQSRLAYVPQHIFLTDGSVAENIAFGVRREQIDMDRVREAGRLAQIDEFVQGLDKGYEEQIGERGVRLSGGQRQRIGIARALYRDASVLVFDEATSALDGLTEQEVMSAIEGLQGQRTIILIAHRLTTVRHCDAIFEFENGRVARSGTYEELLATSERFRRMAGVSHPASTS